MTDQEREFLLSYSGLDYEERWLKSGRSASTDVCLALIAELRETREALRMKDIEWQICTVNNQKLLRLARAVRRLQLAPEEDALDLALLVRKQAEECKDLL